MQERGKEIAGISNELCLNGNKTELCGGQDSVERERALICFLLETDKLGAFENQTPPRTTLFTSSKKHASIRNTTVFKSSFKR